MGERGISSRIVCAESYDCASCMDSHLPPHRNPPLLTSPQPSSAPKLSPGISSHRIASHRYGLLLSAWVGLGQAGLSRVGWAWSCWTGFGGWAVGGCLSSLLKLSWAGLGWVYLAPNEYGSLAWRRSNPTMAKDCERRKELQTERRMVEMYHKT